MNYDYKITRLISVALIQKEIQKKNYKNVFCF